MAFVAISTVVATLTAVLSRYRPALFRPYFVDANPLVVIASAIVVGGICLSFLRSRGLFETYSPAHDSFWPVAVTIVPTVLTVPAIAADVMVGFPRSMNVTVPDALLFYPAIGYVAEVSFHLLPLSLFFLIVQAPSTTSRAHRLLWAGLLFAACSEPLFQVGFSLSSQGFTALQGFVGVHVLIFSVVALWVFRRYDFVTMYLFRLVPWWHIVWGTIHSPPLLTIRSSVPAAHTLKSSVGGVRKRRGCLTADKRGGLADECVIRESGHHEEGEVDAAREVALENGVAHVPAPHGQALALALFEAASAHNGTSRVAGKHSPARLHLVVELGEASEARERAEDVYDRLELPRIDVLAITRDVPPAREHQTRPRTRVVEDRLGLSGRVLVDPPGYEYDEHAVTPRDRALDDLAVIRRPLHDGDASLEGIELLDATRAADADHLVPAIQRVLHHVLSKLPRGPDDTHLHTRHASEASLWSAAGPPL